MRSWEFATNFAIKLVKMKNNLQVAALAIP